MHSNTTTATSGDFYWDSTSINKVVRTKEQVDTFCLEHVTLDCWLEFSKGIRKRIYNNLFSTPRNLPAPGELRAICGNDYIYEDPAMFIMTFLDWQSTPEGAHFWGKIYNTPEKERKTEKFHTPIPVPNVIDPISLYDKIMPNKFRKW